MMIPTRVIVQCCKNTLFHSASQLWRSWETIFLTTCSKRVFVVAAAHNASRVNAP